MIINGSVKAAIKLLLAALTAILCLLQNSVLRFGRKKRDTLRTIAPGRESVGIMTKIYRPNWLNFQSRLKALFQFWL